MNRLAIFALAAMLLPAAAVAQDSAATANPISSWVKQRMTGATRNMVAAAEMMPAEKYGYMPMPGMMTFGQQILHDVQMNNMLCGMISGKPAPDTKDLKDTDGKDKLVAGLKASFDFCNSALATADDSNLGASAGKMGPMSLSRGGAYMLLNSEWADHYGAEATYLRLNGMLPPSAQPRKP